MSYRELPYAPLPRPTMNTPTTLSEALTLTQRTRWSRTKDEERASAMIERIIGQFGDLPLRGIGPPTARSVASWLEARGSGPATVNRYLSALQAVLRTAEEYGGPLTPRFRRHREPKGRIRVLTAEERAHLLAEDSVRIGFCLYSGARRGELLKLTRDNFVNGRVIFRDTKSGSDRSIPWRDKPVLFPPNIGAWWRALVSGLEDPPTPHVLRHTCATDMIRLGITLPVVKEWLGHSSVTTTMRYVHVASGDMERAGDMMMGTLR